MKLALAAALAAAVAGAACTSTERRQDVADSGKGIPVGYRAVERTELRTGDWRFYRLVARDERRVPREDNLVLFDVQRMSGDEGIAAFVRDQHLVERPDGLPPSRFAAQLAMFLVRGQPVDVAGEPAPETRRVGDLVIHRSTLVTGETRRSLVVELAPDGKVSSKLD